MAVCPSCQNQNPGGAASCEHCGFELLPREKPASTARKTRLEAAPARPRSSPFDRAPSQPSPSNPFDRAPSAPTPGRKTVMLGQPKADRNEEPIAAVMVAFRMPGDPGVLFKLRPGRNTLGRATDADICLEDEAVSESHAFVFVDERGGRFLDVSTNGSIVAGQKVHGDQSPLEAGTTLLVGSTVLVFTPLSAPAATIWGMR